MPAGGMISYNRCGIVLVALVYEDANQRLFILDSCNAPCQILTDDKVRTVLLD